MGGFFETPSGNLLDQNYFQNNTFSYKYIGYKKFIDTVSNSLLHLTVRKITLVEFWYRIKKE